MALRLYGPKDIRLEEVKLPEINEDEILLKVKCAAICGTDLRMINHGYRGIDKDNPRIIGHEFSGIIAKVGKNVTGYHEGMAVAVAPNMGCGLCDSCTAGDTHLCRDYRALGIHLDGGFAQYLRIPGAAVRQGNVIAIEEGVSFDEAALNEPLSCVYNGFLRCGVKPGDVVLVIGAGPIGLLHAKLAKMAGAAIVLINDLSRERLNLCRKTDDSLIIVESEVLKEFVMKITDGKGVDVCITACPSPEAQALSLELMAVNGRVNFFGGLPAGKEQVSINTNLIHYKQLVVTGSTRASVSQFRKTLRLISQGLVDVKDLISRRSPLDRFKEAFEAASSGKELKCVINLS